LQVKNGKSRIASQEFIGWSAKRSNYYILCRVCCSIFLYTIGVGYKFNLGAVNGNPNP
jgi:hypothetical protein